jgi:tocopherol O-methyltransferase
MENAIRYYRETDFSYRLGWKSRRHLCMHFGFDENGSRHDAAQLRMVEVVAMKARLTPSDHILDAGCGMGGAALWIAQNVGCRVTGVDVSEDFVRIARQAAAKRGITSARFYRADFRNIPYRAGTFDVALLLESSCHAADKQRLFNEIGRVLKPGGRLVMADGFRSLDTHELDAAFRGWAMINVPTVREGWGFLAAAGFTGIGYECLTPRIIASSRRIHDLSRANLPIFRLLKFLRFKTDISLQHAISGVRQYQALVQGLVEYGIFGAIKQP